MPTARGTNEVILFLGPLVIALALFGVIYRTTIVEVVLSAFR